MGGLDHLLARSLDQIIRDNLGNQTIKRIEKRLFEKYGISLTAAMEDFQKIDIVLREFFGAGTDALEKKFLQSICKAKESKRKDMWVTIEEKVIAQKILEAYGDDEKASIINAVLDKPLIIFDILGKCKIPQTSGYRKTNSLIKDGLLINKGFAVSGDGKKVRKYVSLFDNVRINIVKNKVVVDVLLSKQNFNESSILQVIYVT